MFVCVPPRSDGMQRLGIKEKKKKKSSGFHSTLQKQKTGETREQLDEGIDWENREDVGGLGESAGGWKRKVEMWRVSGWRQSWDEWDFRQNGEKTPKACSGDKGVTQTG